MIACDDLDGQRSMQAVIHFPKSATTGHQMRRCRFGTVRAVFALMLREMSTTYGQSPGGYTWAILEPAAAIALLSAIFAIGFRAPPIGHDFAIFYATGMLPFLAFTHVSAAVSAAINYSKSLLAYPSVTFVDAILARFLLNMMTQVVVFLIIMTSLLWFLEARSTFDILIILQSLMLTGCLALGIGTFNCFLASMFPLWQRIWSVITRPLFLVSGVIFILEIVPQPYRDYLWYNPLIHVVSLMRSGFYAGYDATWASPLFVVLVSSISFTIGLIFLRRYHRDILHR